jgi:hypothetical protein
MRKDVRNVDIGRQASVGSRQELVFAPQPLAIAEPVQRDESRRFFPDRSTGKSRVWDGAAL